MALIENGHTWAGEALSRREVRGVVLRGRQALLSISRLLQLHFNTI
jgi:hypothetical protein